jgi:hypothetical protein
MNTHDQTSPHANIFMILLSWLGWFFGALTLSQWVMSATLIYTALQIYISLRKIYRERNL